MLFFFRGVEKCVWDANLNAKCKQKETQHLMGTDYRIIGLSHYLIIWIINRDAQGTSSYLKRGRGEMTLRTPHARLKAGSTSMLEYRCWECPMPGPDWLWLSCCPKELNPEWCQDTPSIRLTGLMKEKKKRLLLRHFQGQMESLPLTHIEKISFRSIRVEIVICAAEWYIKTFPDRVDEVSAIGLPLSRYSVWSHARSRARQFFVTNHSKTCSCGAYRSLISALLTAVRKQWGPHGWMANSGYLHRLSPYDR